MNLKEAIEAMKEGKAVRATHWVHKNCNMFVRDGKLVFCPGWKEPSEHSLEEYEAYAVTTGDHAWTYDVYEPASGIIGTPEVVGNPTGAQRSADEPDPTKEGDAMNIKNDTQ
jgi:hypothetical protein